MATRFFLKLGKVKVQIWWGSGHPLQSIGTSCGELCNKSSAVAEMGEHESTLYMFPTYWVCKWLVVVHQQSSKCRHNLYWLLQGFRLCCSLKTPGETCILWYQW